MTDSLENKTSTKPAKVHDCDASVQKRHIAGVYLILIGQLIVINIAVSWNAIVHAQSTRVSLDGQMIRFIDEQERVVHPIITIVAIVVVLLTLLVMFVLADSVGRLWPVNLLLLAVFTVATACLFVALVGNEPAPFLVDTIMLVTILFGVQLIYAWLPCLPYSFLVSGIISLICTVTVAAWFIASNPNAFLMNWNIDYTWILPTNNGQRDAALDSVFVWITLLITLIFVWLFQWQLYRLSFEMEPSQHVQCTFFLFVYVMMTFVFLLQTAALSLNNWTGRCTSCWRPRSLL